MTIMLKIKKSSTKNTNLIVYMKKPNIADLCLEIPFNKYVNNMYKYKKRQSYHKIIWTIET